jgi:hypothetical protein
MRVSLKIFIALSLGIFLITGGICPAGAQDERIRAKIGISVKSGDRVMRAKSQDRLKEGDLLRIYVHPEKASHIYVIHNDLNEATLLNTAQQKIRSSTLVMPSIQEFYQIDGKSPTETFTIIVSPDELTGVSDVLGGGKAPSARWLEAEKALIDRGRIELSQETEKPFPISGNVRGVKGNGDSFVSELQIFSGKSVLVKRYEFRVKK